MTVGSEYVVIGPMVLVLCPSVLVLALVLNLVVLLTSLQDALDRRRGELTRSAHPDAPLLARRGEPTPNTPSVSSWCDHSMLASLQQLVVVIANWLFCAADNARRGFHYRHSPNVEKYHHSGRVFRPVFPLFDMRFVIIFMSADHTVYCMVQHLWFWLLKLFCRAGE